MVRDGQPETRSDAEAPNQIAPYQSRNKCWKEKTEDEHDEEVVPVLPLRDRVFLQVR